MIALDDAAAYDPALSPSLGSSAPSAVRANAACAVRQRQVVRRGPEKSRLRADGVRRRQPDPAHFAHLRGRLGPLAATSRRLRQRRRLRARAIPLILDTGPLLATFDRARPRPCVVRRRLLVTELPGAVLDPAGAGARGRSTRCRCCSTPQAAHAERDRQQRARRRCRSRHATADAGGDSQRVSDLLRPLYAATLAARSASGHRCARDRRAFSTAPVARDARPSPLRRPCTPARDHAWNCCPHRGSHCARTLGGAGQAEPLNVSAQLRSSTVVGAWIASS